MKIDILHRWTGAVLYSGDHNDRSATILAAIKSGADLSGADLSGADLSGDDLSGADLSGADLSRAYLMRANLSRAYLSGADLSRAYLSRANLSGADLSGADLSGANLSGADLSGADLSRAYLSRANLSRAYLSGADLSRAYLSRANLSGADLSGADLSGADLSGADLSGANLSRAVGLNKHLVTPLLMLRDQPGAIRAYKLVTADGLSPIAPDNGHAALTYSIGAEIVASANTDENKQCGAGVNLATLDWCLREWRSGYRVLIAEHTAEDIAAIPTGSDGKYRVHRCRIVGEVDLAEIGWVPR